MLQATIYADRSAIGTINTCELAYRAQPEPLGSALSRWLKRGRLLLQGWPDETLDRHLLEDIGLSHADLEALSL